MFSRSTFYFFITPLLVVLMATASYAKDFIIYSIAQELPMGYAKEKKIKNYYINIGKSQGIKDGTMLDVFRVQSELNPYESNKRYNYKIKIGELKVIHSDQEAAIGRIEKMRDDEDLPIFEFQDLIIGDQVSVHVK